MGTIYENVILNNIISLCDAHSPKVSPSKMCVDLGISKSLITKLRNHPERSINGETARKIAEYFNVSVDRVLGTEQKEKSPAPEGVELSDLQKQAIEFVLTLSDDQLRQFIRIGQALISEK